MKLEVGFRETTQVYVRHILFSGNNPGERDDSTSVSLFWVACPVLGRLSGFKAAHEQVSQESRSYLELELRGSLDTRRTKPMALIINGGGGGYSKSVVNKSQLRGVSE